MKKTKKIVAMALAVIMVFGVATTAFAAEWEWDGFVEIREGSNNAYVRAAQNICKYNLMLSSVTADGIFGSNTKSAIEQFQRTYSLDDDGIVGERTWHTMQQMLDEPWEQLRRYSIEYGVNSGDYTSTKFFEYKRVGGATNVWYTYRAVSGTDPGTWYYIE